MSFVRPRLILVFCALSALACAHAQVPAGTEQSILAAKGDSVRVRLYDVTTAKPIASTDFELTSDNGIRCIKAPCPTDGKSWKGESDAKGEIVIPRSALNTTASITSASYHGDLAGDASPAAGGGWTLDLFPETGTDPAPHPLKLLDATTHQPIANVTLRIEARNSGGFPNMMSLTSNALGYVFVPADFVAHGAQTSWVVVPGYRDARVDFAWARRKTFIDKR
ncbi:MAG: hypothetical protein ABIQ10_10905 [Gemmatimonadaceae bacterium]